MKTHSRRVTRTRGVLSRAETWAIILAYLWLIVATVTILR
jgi:hypothetical protein